jgi:glycosyltransferase involved in cell wall biosynthesis
MSPRVSICVPNLNTLPFLPERFESIFAQTFKDWELFVFDSYSDDGAWEYIQSIATCQRMRLAQGPRLGPYPAWNECLKQTEGEYVYIATSDDTMAPDCLQKLVAALDRHPHCDLAHCSLRVIDSSGAQSISPNWPETTVFADSLPRSGMVSLPHVRHAPYDGLLHLTGRQVYQSITQLLIRRSLFAKIGEFPNKWGYASDVNWEIKAGLVANTVHVPDTWASWRRHPGQLTENFWSVENDQRRCDMIDDAVRSCLPLLHPALVKSDWFSTTKTLRTYYRALSDGRGMARRRLYQARQFLTGPSQIRIELLRQVFGRPKWPEGIPAQIRSWLDSNGLGPAITPAFL